MIDDERWEDVTVPGLRRESQKSRLSRVTPAPLEQTATLLFLSSCHHEQSPCATGALEREVRPSIGALPLLVLIDLCAYLGTYVKLPDTHVQRYSRFGVARKLY